jgi:hypothetical protein
LASENPSLGLVIGLPRWLLGTLLAPTLCWGQANVIGVSLSQTPLASAFSVTGMALRLAVVNVLEAPASLLLSCRALACELTFPRSQVSSRRAEVPARRQASLVINAEVSVNDFVLTSGKTTDQPGVTFKPHVTGFGETCGGCSVATEKSNPLPLR